MVGGRGRPVMLDSEVRSPGEGRGLLVSPGAGRSPHGGGGHSLEFLRRPGHFLLNLWNQVS